MNMLLWVLVVALTVALVAQGLVMRAGYRRKVAEAQAKQARLEEAAHGRLEQTKRQVAKLQNDLEAARLQVKHLTKAQPAPAKATRAAAAGAGASAAAAASNREALEEELGRGDAEHAKQPLGDGFADTQPAVSTQFGGLLLQ